MVFDLEHEKAHRIQLVQTSESDFELRMQLAEGVASEPVFQG